MYYAVLNGEPTWWLLQPCLGGGVHSLASSISQPHGVPFKVSQLLVFFTIVNLNLLVFTTIPIPPKFSQYVWLPAKLHYSAPSR